MKKVTEIAENHGFSRKECNFSGKFCSNLNSGPTRALDFGARAFRAFAIFGPSRARAFGLFSTGQKKARNFGLGPEPVPPLEILGLEIDVFKKDFHDIVFLFCFSCLAPKPSSPTLALVHSKSKQNTVESSGLVH